jgi:hypothetical protein
MGIDSPRAGSGFVPGAWGRGGPIEGHLSLSSVLIDQGQADVACVDLKDEGFSQLFSGVPEIAVPTADLLVAIATPYDVEVLRRSDFDPRALNQPAFLAGTFPDQHPTHWMKHITEQGLLVIVVPNLIALDGPVLLDDLRPSWCAFAGVVTTL